ncbi:MAG: transporter [Saprospiraceae bacterium]|nr:transporter [Saprospiraceae bacterium]
MKHTLLFILAFLLFRGPHDTLHAQTQTDGIMMPKGDFCVAVMAENGTWDQYWEGTRLIKNDNIGTLSRLTVMPMIAYGITNRIMVLAQLPWVKTKASGGQMAGVQGFQDLGLAIKGNLFSRDIGKGTLHIFATGEYALPATNYLSDYMPFSLGLGAHQITARAMVHYRWDMGLYLRGMGGHIWRTYTRIERDYYYKDGSYYSEWMDVPNAVHAQAVAGYYFLNDLLQLELQYTLLHATDGDDIRTWNPAQPTNRMNMDLVGGSLRFYAPGQLAGLSVIAGYQHTVAGRNVGQTSALFGGITYQFNILNR